MRKQPWILETALSFKRLKASPFCPPKEEHGIESTTDSVSGREGFFKINYYKFNKH